MSKYDYIKKHECIIDYATVGYVQDKKEQLRNISIVCRTLGIIMCIISFVPAAVFDAIPIQGLDDIGGAAMICIVSVGVFLIVFGSMAETSCKTLLALNGDNVAGSYVKKENKEVRYINNTATTIMSVFWPTVTCIYLSVSFITFAWALTWVIWPIAAVICTSQQKVDTTLYFYTSFNEHNTPYTVLESDNSESMPDVLH